MKGQLKPIAVLKGLIVYAVLGLGMWLAVSAFKLAAGPSLALLKEFPAPGWQSWTLTAAVYGRGVVAGVATGLAAGRRETLHAGLLILVQLVFLVATSMARGFGSVTDELLGREWSWYGLAVSPLLGGVAVEWWRVRNDRVPPPRPIEGATT